MVRARTLSGLAEKPSLDADRRVLPEQRVTRNSFLTPRTLTACTRRTVAVCVSVSPVNEGPCLTNVAYGRGDRPAFRTAALS